MAPVWDDGDRAGGGGGMKNACQPYMTTAARMIARKILRSMDEIYARR